MIADRARAIAEDVLLPAALAVDAADRIPASHLDLLASEGIYGAALTDPDQLGPIIEALAGGCLSTAFVWIQHNTPLLAAAAAGREDLAAAFASGERRGGIGLAGLRSPQDPMRVRATDDGYVLTGSVPWVTGWGMIDTVYIAARDEHDVIHCLLVDAVPSVTLSVTPLQLVAVQASGTVNLTFADHHVPASALLSTEPMAEWSARDSSGSVHNGFLALGLTSRCCRLIGSSPLDARLEAARADLIAADAAGTPAARAQASELAMRAASRLAVATGARAVLRDQQAQRLVREATFLLVFGSRPAIKAELLSRLG